MLSVRNLTKTYKLSKKGKGGGKKVVALNNVSIDFPDKGMVFLLGKSGSGKSTLLNSIGGLDTFDSGEIIIKGKSSKNFSQSDFDSYRNTFIGFVFQEYNILEEFTIGKNLALALELQGKKADKAKVEELLKLVDLDGYYKRKPNQLSGGQKQRIAIARALIKEPEIIMADEPTGALDSTTGKQVMDTLKKLSQTKLVIVVSHDREFAELYGDRIIELRDGVIISDRTKQKVLSQKSESGVSYIGENLIHIKKGQRLSVNDFDKISRKLIENSQNDDIIISFDKKTNDEVKKTSFITDDGNQEVFTPTKQVYQTKSDPKNFKLIKSHLKFKDSFKIGAGSLRHKPIRLFFTILLSLVAFTLFGLVDTMSSYDSFQSLYGTIQAEKPVVLPFAMRLPLVDDQGYTYELTRETNKTDLQEAESKLKTKIYPVIHGGDESYQYYLQGLQQTTTVSGLYQSIISGIMQIDSNIQSELDLKLEGSLPTTSEEVCISKNIFDSLKKKYNLSGLSDLTKDTVKLVINGDSFKIVGVLTDKNDLDKYKDTDSNFMAQTSLQTSLSYGLTNMVYCNSLQFEKMFKNTYMNLYGVDNNYSLQTNSVRTYNEEHSGVTFYAKSGVDYTKLTGKQIIVSKRIFAELHGLSSYTETSKLKEYLETERTLTFYEYCGYDDTFKGVRKHTFDVVGFTENAYYSFYVSEEFKNNNLYHYTYALAKTSSVNNLEHIVEVLDKNGAYTIITPAAATINMFGSMIESMSQPFLYVGIGLAVFASLMLMNFISTSISYKKREIGVLRAIGARGKDVFSIFFLESLIICLINFVLAVVACPVACLLINNSMLNAGIELTLLTFGLRQVLLIFLISFAVAFIASFLPVYRIAKKNPIDSINNR